MFSPEIIKRAEEAEKLTREQFDKIDSIERLNSEKILKAFINKKVSSAHFNYTNGYGYGDAGREKIDEVFAEILGAEDALVRHNFVNGTHAISTAMFGILRPGDTLLSVTGKPYETLNSVIFAEKGGSLKEFGINYAQVDLCQGDFWDLEKIKTGISQVSPKLIYIQRSCGYTLRSSLNIQQIKRIISFIKKINPDIIILVDNCYGELCEIMEPTAVGADLIVGSLIKNLGGGIAETGGYIAGKKDLLNLCAKRLTTVGTGREVGCTLNQNRGILLGLFHAPSAVANALRTSVFTCAMAELSGYEACPSYSESRTDIIAALKLGSREKLIRFCKEIQAASPIDSFLSPEPWAMPGYDDEIIMAAGCFTAGASLELSADAPLRSPYAVWVQGGVSYHAAKLAVMSAFAAI